MTAVESSTGDTIWSFELPEGDGAVRSVVVDDSLVVGTEAPREGDVRPPIVYSLDLADGSLLCNQNRPTAVLTGVLPGDGAPKS